MAECYQTYVLVTVVVAAAAAAASSIFQISFIIVTIDTLIIQGSEKKRERGKLAKIPDRDSNFYCHSWNLQSLGRSDHFNLIFHHPNFQ